MRILQLHSDFIEYEPIAKELKKGADEVISRSKVRLEELAVILVSVEQEDDDSVVGLAVEEIKNFCRTVKTNRILVYPYSHLSSNLATPGIATQIIDSIEKAVASLPFDVHRAPFGWTKGFNIKVKGHPLAESAKVLTNANKHSSFADALSNSQDKDYSMALNAEVDLKSFWYILKPNGELIPVNDYEYKNEGENLHALVAYEMAKERRSNGEPAHVRLMKKMGIADYEPASDSGNLRFYPKGKLMKALMEQYVTMRVIRYGGIEVETPIMYDGKHPSMESYLNRFPARQYNILGDKKRHLILRFAACFGQFLMAKDFQLSYKQLPLRLYELTRYSFRREKSGELAGLRRLRAFSMPDCHALCKDMDQAKQEFLKRFELSLDVIDSLGLSTTEDIEMAIRFTEEFYNENKNFIKEIVSLFNRPVLVEMWKEKFFYFVLKWEFNFIDTMKKASALSTDQIDVENGERYQITFVDERGDNKHPIILHNSPSGAIERILYALLEKSARVAKSGQKASFPLWLSHTQVRIIPVNKEHLPHCDKLSNELSSKFVRADIDDRDESISKKIRESETEWIRYTLVIGNNELQTGTLVVRDRQLTQQRKLQLQQLIDEIHNQTIDKPHLPLNLPRYLSMRPIITG
jgi:threonyl-tRNA synthetase